MPSECSPLFHKIWHSKLLNGPWAPIPGTSIWRHVSVVLKKHLIDISKVKFHVMIFITVFFIDDQAPLWYVISYSRGMHYNKSGRATIICKEHHTYLLWSAIMVSVNTIERFFCAHCCPTFSLHRWARDRLFSPHHHWTVYTLSLITIYSTEEGICSEEQNDGTVPAEE